MIIAKDAKMRAHKNNPVSSTTIEFSSRYFLGYLPSVTNFKKK